MGVPFVSSREMWREDEESGKCEESIHEKFSGVFRSACLADSLTVRATTSASLWSLRDNVCQTAKVRAILAIGR